MSTRVEDARQRISQMLVVISVATRRIFSQVLTYRLMKVGSYDAHGEDLGMSAPLFRVFLYAQLLTSCYVEA